MSGQHIRKEEMQLNRLRGRIIESGFTLKTFAKEIGMPYGSLSRKLNKGTFTWTEVQKMADALGILDDADELRRVFFTSHIHN